MRTTVRLPDALMREVKAYAAERGLTLTRLIEDALREVLARREAADGPTPAPLPTDGAGGLLPGVDLDDVSGLEERMRRSDGPA